MEKFLYPFHPVRCIITGPSECCKSYSLPNSILINFNDFEKIYIYSPSLPQHFYQNTIKCSSNYIPIQIIPNILNEEDIDTAVDEIVND